MKLTKSDLQLYSFLVIFYTLHIILASVGVFYRKIEGIQFQSYSKIDLLVELSLNWLLFSFFIFVILITTKKLIFKNHKWYKILGLHLILSIFFTIFLWCGITFLLLILNRIKLHEITFDAFFRQSINSMDENFTLYFVFVAFIYTYYFLQKSKADGIEKERLQLELVNSKIKSLRSQLQPHFLFNTLNSIYTLIDSDKEKSKKMLLNLSDLLRELTKDNKEKLITLNEELNFTNKYLDIIKERFSSDLKISINIDEETKKHLVPNLILQPIIENSIKHGYSKENLTLHITIDIKNKENIICIEISNNGKLLTLDLKRLIKKGIGIKNTLKRLDLLYEKNYEYKFYNKNKLVVTQINLPKIHTNFNSQTLEKHSYL